MVDSMGVSKNPEPDALRLASVSSAGTYREHNYHNYCMLLSSSSSIILCMNTDHDIVHVCIASYNTRIMEFSKVMTHVFLTLLTIITSETADPDRLY